MSAVLVTEPHRVINNIYSWTTEPTVTQDSPFLHTQLTLFAIKGSNNKKSKTKKKKRNKPLQDKSNTTRQHNSILGLIFSTQSTNDIIGYGELAQKIRLDSSLAVAGSTASTHSCLPTDGWLRLSRPGCLVLRRGGLPVQRWSPIQALTGPGVE